MDNQHKLIKGYRDLSEKEIELINAIKAHGSAMELLVDELKASEADQRWIAIGVTQIQLGLMAITRGVAKPTSF